MVAAVFEAKMSREQAEQLAELMREHRPTRPAGVLTAALLVDGEDVQLVAVWQDRETLQEYLDSGAVPRGPLESTGVLGQRETSARGRAGTRQPRRYVLRGLRPALGATNNALGGS